MGVGSGIGIDMVESENIPKEVDIQETLDASEKDNSLVKDFTCGMNTMMI